MYLRLDESFATHPKTMMFVGRMQDPNAAMYLIKLWTWAVRSAPAGDISEMLPWSIEDVVGYRLQDGRCYAAMVASGFIDEIETGAPKSIHNWAKRTGGDIAKMETEAQRKRNYRAAKPWDVLRLEILTRDGFACKDCGRTPEDQGDLEVHHVIPLRKFEDKVAGNNPSNLKTLCSRCHSKAEAEYRKSEKENGTAVGRRSDGGPADDQTAPETADTDKARQVQARSGSDSLPSRGSVPPVQTPARSENRARLWPAGSWLTRFGAAWAEHYQQLAYGQPGDSKACGPLQDVLDALPESERLAAQEKAPAMFAEFLGRADSKTVERRHPFAFFVQEWGGLRVAKKPVVLPGGKPWQAADKAAEAARGADRAARRIAQENLDRLIAGEKATG